MYRTEPGHLGRPENNYGSKKAAAWLNGAERPRRRYFTASFAAAFAFLACDLALALCTFDLDL